MNGKEALDQMEIFWDINQIHSKQKSIVTIGIFDGVHRGHQQIIRQMRDIANRKDLITTLVTFEPHPQLVLRNQEKRPLRILTMIEEKIDILNKIGLKRLVVANFNKDFANIEPVDFIQNYLKKKLLLTEMVIGYDHSFGRNRKGNIELLQNLANKLNFQVQALPAKTIDNQIISSTLIRSLIAEGAVGKAAEFLDRPYRLNGRVIRGDGRGKELGYPTANIRPFSSYKLIPNAGVYTTFITIDGQTFESTTYIGNRSTFNLQQNVIEVYIHEFENDIYDMKVDLEFIDFIRNDKKFESSKGLIKQIQKDIEQSRELFDKIRVN